MPLAPPRTGSAFRRQGEMSEATLKAVLKREVANSIGGDYGTTLTSEHSQALIEQREQALQAYYGEPIGNEVEGRSQVIMTDVADTLEWMMPSLLEFLTAPEQVCSFKPVRAIHADAMEDAALLVHHLLFDENDGYRLLYDFIHDGLLLKTGIFKVTADREPVMTKAVKQGLTDEELALYESEDGVEVTEDEVDEDDVRITTFLVETRKGQLDIQVLRPETFAVSNLAEDLDDSAITFHIDELTRSDLIEMGYDEDKVYALTRWEGNGFTQQVQRERFQVDSSVVSEEVSTLDKSKEEVLVFEIYMAIDFDGDGVAERRKILAAGPHLEILDNIEIDDEHPFVTWCPFPVPHKFFGQSLADRVYDIQIIHSTLVRQGLDSAYNANINRVVADIDAIDPDDLLTNNLSGVVKMDLAGNSMDKTVRDVLMPITNTPIDVAPMLEYIQGVRRDRTGVDPYSQDATTQALGNSASGTAINLLQTSGRKKQEMIARHVADAVAQLCQKILNLAIQNGITVEIQQDNGEFHVIDPSGWSMDMIAKVEVGLGYGSRDRELAASTDLFGIQMQLAQLQEGADGPLVKARHINNAVSRFVIASQLGSPRDYVVTEDDNEEQPSVEEIRAQVTQEIMQSAEMQKFQMELQKLQAETEGKQIEAEGKTAMYQAQIQLEQIKAQNAQMQPQLEAERNQINLQREVRTADIDEQKAELEAGLKMNEAQTKVSDIDAKLTLEREKLAQQEAKDTMDHEIDLEKLEIEREKVAVARKAAENPPAQPKGNK